VLATVAGIYLFLISYLTGPTDIVVRDGALIGCCLALFVSVNRTSPKPIDQKWIRLIWFAYVFFLFAAGMSFIRHGGT
jgi:hypothetical protein